VRAAVTLAREAQIPRFRARRGKNALFQWEEDNPPGNCCSSRK
jgi:hypothetical protein